MTRKEFAQQVVIQLISRNYDPKNVVKLAADIVSEMYKGYHDEPSETRQQIPIVSIAEHDGQKGVRLCVGDIDMFIEAHDLDDGKEYEWPDAMKRLKEVGKETFSHKQGLLMAAYHNEINAALREISGDELKCCYCSSTEANPNYAWYVNFNDGDIYYAYKYNKFTVRPVTAF